MTDKEEILKKHDQPDDVLVKKWAGTIFKPMEGISKWEDKVELAELLEYEAKVMLDKYGREIGQKRKDAPDVFTPLIRDFKQRKNL
jgi:hypothetical protein